VRRALLLLAAPLAFAALLFAMMWSPDRILFPTDMVPPAGPLPRGAETLTLESADGETLHGVYIRPSANSDGPRTLILGFGGNGWNGQHVAEYLHEVFPQEHVAAFHYRGYRPSTGSPSAEALVADAPLVLDRAVDLVKPERTIAVGFSIGSGVAATLARRPEIEGLILVTPFDSLKALAASLYPWLPLGAFFRHELHTAEYLAGSDVPVAILAAERDEIVAPERTDALREKVPNLVFDRTIPGAGHNDIYARSDFQGAMDEALEAVRSRHR
jgi:uncharacterized protein